MTVADDLSSWAWKDVDELAWSVEVGKIGPQQAEEIREAGQAAISLVESRGWPFRDSEWHRFIPEDHWLRPGLPDDWRRTEWS